MKPGEGWTQDGNLRVLGELETEARLGRDRRSRRERGKKKEGGGREGIIHSLFIYNMNSARKCAGC